MNQRQFAHLLAIAVCVFALGRAAMAEKARAATAAADFRPVKPETVGFSSERLDRLHELIQNEIDNKALAGAVTILARHGKVVDYRTYGMRDIAMHAPMTKDVIFRDYSMTKPVTGVAMMILYEEGKWLPSDPISKYVPEFADLKVFAGLGSAGKMILAEPEHPPTMRELMTHSAGFSYGSGHSAVDALYHDRKLMQSHDLHEMVQKLATIPLNYQPGKGWTYSVSMDVEGYIVEKLSGQSLPEFMRRYVFNPLGMKDSGFFVPQGKRARFATNYRDTPEQQVSPVSNAGQPPDDYLSEPAMASGGGGMVSTIEDYYRFAQMLGNRGELDGVRILAPSSVALMTSNHLPERLLTGEFGIGQHIMRPGFGYGFNCAVVFDPAAALLPDGKGTFFWDGAAGTWFWVDPANDIVFVGMIQRMTSHDNHSLEYRSHSTVYQALVDPSK